MLTEARKRPTVILSPSPARLRRAGRSFHAMTLMPTDGTVISSTPTSDVFLNGTSAHRVWYVEVELLPAGREAFVVAEELLVPVYEQGPAVGDRVPATVNPVRDEATISVTSLTGITPGTADDLRANGIHVLVSDDVIDPVEIRQLLDEHERRTRPTVA